MRHYQLRFIVMAVCTACTVLAISACKSEKAAPNVLAKVGNQYITINDFQRKVMEFNNSQKSQALDELVKQKILNDLIEQELILKEAETHNIVITPSELDSEVQKMTENYPGKEFEKMLISRHLTPNEWREVTKKTLLLKKTFNRLTDNKQEFSDQQINDYYEKNKERFQLPEQAHALHILVDSEQDAFDVMAQLRKGTPFETLARERSLGPEAQSGGDLGFFAKGSMPELFDEVIFALEVGKMSRVVHSEYGYHLFKLLDRRNAHLRTLEECRNEIREQLDSAAKQQLYSKWLEGTLKSTKIMKNHALLKKLNF